MAALLRCMRTWGTMVLLGAVAAGLAGCGVKGPLEPPPGAKASGEAKSADAADPGKNSDAPPKPHENFILDPLLR
ncbi:LPS translocon maturation chaperone LptM [Hyphomicrobium sp. MC8b]|uniref:LPS translocon maturation chaperone LptM n=1 Tax=Hyphomicrobium sp. MC8b TaxID=300273 RepID=UPI003918EB56